MGVKLNMPPQKQNHGRRAANDLPQLTYGKGKQSKQHQANQPVYQPAQGNQARQVANSTANTFHNSTSTTPVVTKNSPNFSTILISTSH